MIGFAHDKLVELVVAPQDSADRGELRAWLDPNDRPIDVAPQEVTLRDVTTIPVGFEIGGVLQLRHTIAVAVEVAHLDPAESRRLRDGIVLDLVRRLLATRGEFEGAIDYETGEQIEQVAALVDYRPMPGGSDTSESATITVTVDSMIDG